MPTYHTTCTCRTSIRYEEARAIIAGNLNAPPDEYAVIFVGTGSTAAIAKFVQVVGLQRRHYSHLAPYGPKPPVGSDSGNSEQHPDWPVVFVGPYEHHSNELMWREHQCDVVVIGEDCVTGNVDYEELERQLAAHANRPMRIGSFSAGSNVTGISPDVNRLSTILHAGRALAAFDFAGAGAYVNISMAAPPGQPLAYKDAIFLSPHKFLGGPGSPGLLVARKELFPSVPTVPAGGTVSFVSPWAQYYEGSVEAREEGGTPGILQGIRCGLAFSIRNQVSIHIHASVLLSSVRWPAGGQMVRALCRTHLPVAKAQSPLSDPEDQSDTDGHWLLARR